MIEHARDRPVKFGAMVAHRTEPDHGTRQRYQHRSLKCHCPECRAANTAYIARYRRDVRGTHTPRWIEQSLPFNDR